MEAKATERAVSGAVLLVCFSSLSWLNGRYVGSEAGQVALYTFLGLLISSLFLAAIAWLVYASATPLRARGFSGAWDAVARGFLLLLPLTVLALLADLFFSWGSAQAFTQAGIMTSGAAVGAEVMRRAGPRISYMAAPIAGAFCFSFAWIGYTVLFSRAAG
jgi:hypothetical protein